MKEKVIDQTWVPLFFSDFFKVSKNLLDEYGAYDISLVADLPLFIDPFLLFGSDKEVYQNLHKEIIKYLRFLRDQSGNIEKGLIKSWFSFHEVEQTWLGFSRRSNKGAGLGNEFAKSLNNNLATILKDFGDEKQTKSSHLEKLCLVQRGVGKDTISDFTTNLIKGYLAGYTEQFTKLYLNHNQSKLFSVDKAYFDYNLKRWMPKQFRLPLFNNEYVLLTPKDILTKENTWINRDDLIDVFDSLPEALTNEELRAQVNNYFKEILKDIDEPTEKERKEAAIKTISHFPQLIDTYIKQKEDNAEAAIKNSEVNVETSKKVINDQFATIAHLLQQKTGFYNIDGLSYREALERAKYLKHVIEDCDGYKSLYVDGKPIEKEENIQILYRLTWFTSVSSADREVNNGRGPADYKASFGTLSSALIEFKVAKNTHLRSNLKHQVETYQKANPDSKKIKVIIFFTQQQKERVDKILEELGIENAEWVVMIDARNDNKPSASKVK